MSDNSTTNSDDAYKWSKTSLLWIMMPISGPRQFVHEWWCLPVVLDHSHMNYDPTNDLWSFDVELWCILEIFHNSIMDHDSN